MLLKWFVSDKAIKQASRNNIKLKHISSNEQYSTMLFGEMVIYVEAWTPNYSIKASKIKEFKKCAPLGTAAQDISMHATNKHFAEARQIAVSTVKQTAAVSCVDISNTSR